MAAHSSSLDHAEILEDGEAHFAEDDRLSRLLDQAEKFCARFGVGEDIILETYTETSDWAFFVKVDALHETACRDLTARLLSIRPSLGAHDKDISAFIDDIDFHGRGSVLRLIEVMRRPADYVGFLQSVRRIRNAFAHDFRSVNETLMEVVKRLSDRRQLLKTLSGIADEAFDEAKYMRIVRNDPGFLRFEILQRSMALLSQLHANFPDPREAGLGAAPDRDAVAAKPAPAVSGERKLGLFGRGASSSPSMETEAPVEPDRRATPAVFSRRSFTNPARPNQTRSLLMHYLVFSAKGLVALAGLAAAAGIYSFFGIWPAIPVAVIPLLPIALDKWTPGAWTGHCPQCDSEIAVPPSKRPNLAVRCPVCGGHIVPRNNSFVAY